MFYFASIVPVSHRALIWTLFCCFVNANMAFSVLSVFISVVCCSFKMHPVLGVGKSDTGHSIYTSVVVKQERTKIIYQCCNMLQTSTCRDTARKAGARGFTGRKQQKSSKSCFHSKAPTIFTSTWVLELQIHHHLLPANFFKNMIWVILSELIGIILKLLLSRLPEKWSTRAHITLYFVECHVNAALWH